MNKEFLTEVNTYLADLWAANIALHNYHWNIKGQNFMLVHNMTEELYDYAFEQIDVLAELVVQNGEVPASTLGEYAELTTIVEDESKEIGCRDSLSKTKDILTSLRESAIEIAEKSPCLMIANLMEDHITDYAKYIWFIDATLTDM